MVETKTLGAAGRRPELVERRSHPPPEKVVTVDVHEMPGSPVSTSVCGLGAAPPATAEKLKLAGLTSMPVRFSATTTLYNVPPATIVTRPV